MDDRRPTRACIEANAHALARYAALCQEAGLIPIVEPEVLMAGDHTLERCAEVTEEVLRTVFHHLFAAGVIPEGMLLKPNMVLPGSDLFPAGEPGAGGRRTVKCLLRAVPGGRSRGRVPVGRAIGRDGLAH